MLHWCRDDSYGEKLKVNMEEEEKENGGMGRVGMNFFWLPIRGVLEKL